MRQRSNSALARGRAPAGVARRQLAVQRVVVLGHAFGSEQLPVARLGAAAHLGGAMRLLWEQPERAAEMGRRAEARYWELFTAERMAENYHALYRELSARHGGKRAAPRDRAV